jgi:hypothetical protein
MFRVSGKHSDEDPVVFVLKRPADKGDWLTVKDGFIVRASKSTNGRV